MNSCWRIAVLRTTDAIQMKYQAIAILRKVDDAAYLTQPLRSGLSRVC
jgi:hypothetical protein